jgi:hypothetical protein
MGAAHRKKAISFFQSRTGDSHFYFMAEHSVGRDLKSSFILFPVKD